MAIFRIVAAVGALVWIAPHLPRTLWQNLPEMKSDIAATAGQVALKGGQVFANQAVALCAQNPERCASLLSAATTASPSPHPEKPQPAPARVGRAAKEIADADFPVKAPQRKP